MDWNALLIGMELRAETDQALKPILQGHWELYVTLLMQPEQPQQLRLTKEQAKILACVSLDWLYLNDQVPARNQTRISCKWCKQESIINMSITARAITTMGHLVAGPYRTTVKLDNGFLSLPLPRDSTVVRQPHQIRPALGLSLTIQTRDAVFGMLHSRSVYSEQVPRVLPGPRDRSLISGGTIHWRRTESFPPPIAPDSNIQAEISEPSPEPIPESADPHERVGEPAMPPRQEDEPQSASPEQWISWNSWIR